ncbi:hypothetical protein HQ587_07340 [bacterium]|nr:hypothetical protein [bacterium]
MRVGIVAEGITDILVIEKIVRSCLDDIDVKRIQPDYPHCLGSKSGWKGVRSWCEEFGEELETYLIGITNKPINVLIIHLDASMAHKVNANKPCPPASDSTDILRDIIRMNWLGLQSKPPYLVFVTPSLQTETWVVGVLDQTFPNLECSDKVEGELVRRRKLRWKGGRRRPRKLQKSYKRYKPLAKQVAESFQDLCKICTEADRFKNETENAFNNPLT